MITGKQIKAARLLLGWSIEDLASRSGVGRKTIAAFEREESRHPEEWYVSQIKTALERGGAEFPEGQLPQVRLGPVKRASWEWPPER
jgi:transcriptional regulator with XRE-family HTH domain